jgi:hypothetical protein
MNGMSRAASTLLGAGIAGFLLWLAAQIGRNSTGGYWAAYGIVAGAGVVLAASQLRGRGGHPPGMFVFAFVPVLVVAGWVLLGMQPHPNWFRSHVLSWSADIGVRDVVHDVGTWLGVLAFGIGYTLGTTLEPFGRRAVAPAPVVQRTTTTPAATTTPAYDPAASDAPTTAERAEVGDSSTTPVSGRTRRTMLHR